MDKRLKNFAEFYPFYSFVGDWAMYRNIGLGRIKF